MSSNNKTPKLSIITCVYNAEKFLNESLDSIFSQTFKDFELILINDASTDKTNKIIQTYTHHSEIIVLKNMYNEGVPYSRNRGFLKARGEYIAIHDADDASLPYRFKKQVAFLDANPDITIVGGHAIRISDGGKILGSMVYPPEHTRDAFRVITRFKLNPIIDPSCMFRRQAILDVGGYRMEPELRTVQDFDLWCRLLVKGHLLYNFQEPLIKYRINPEGVTRLKKQEQMEATDVVWAAFKRKNFPDVILRPESYQQKSIIDLLEGNENENDTMD